MLPSGWRTCKQRIQTTHANAQIYSLFNLGCILADERDYKEAVAVFNEAVLRPMDSYQPHSPYNMLGEFWAPRLQSTEVNYEIRWSAGDE